MRFVDNEKVLNKYRWLAHYHDTIVDEFNAEFGAGLPLFNLADRPDYTQVHGKLEHYRRNAR